MDCDLQDPPEEIPRLYAKALQGHDIVFGKRKRRHHSWLRTAAARVYFKIVNVFLGTDISGEFGTFSIVSRKVVDAFLSIRDKDRHYLHILFWLGFDHATIDFEHGARLAGKSSYSFGRPFRHAVEGVFFQTMTLLRWIIYFGFLVALSGIALAAFLVYLHAVKSPPEGWTSLAVLVLLVGGFIIISTGVTGLYIGMIFKQVKDRPLYVIDVEEMVRTPGSPVSRRTEVQEAERVR